MKTKIFSLMLLSCFMWLSTPSYAVDSPNILIMGEDVDTDTIPRNNRIFKRVVNAISEQVNQEGFDVFDETAITLDDFKQHRTRRSDAELVDIARSVKRPPIDVIVVFAIYTNVKTLDYTTKVGARIEGRLLNVRTGQRLGNFEVETPNSVSVPTDCNRECLLESVGKHTKTLSADLGAVLTTKLAHLVDNNQSDFYDTATTSSGGLPNAYILRFENFSNDEILEIEEYLTVFKGYKKHRPTNTSLRLYEIWYETSSASARLNRNLVKMLNHIGLKGRIVFSGNTFTIEKINLRKKRNIDPSQW